MKDTFDFFAQEERCGHIVTSKVKQLWSIQLDLLKAFDDVCKKNNLKYFSIAGTLLGAIRHKGYIPWDDDIDLGMERNDYDKFVKIAKNEFKDPYFLQSAYDDIDYAGAHVKLRNSQTLCATKYDFGFEYNKGVFIDIFPIDNLPDNQEDKDALYTEVNKYKRILDIGIRKFYYIGDEIISEEEKQSVKDYLEKNPFKEVYKEFEKACAKYKDDKTLEKGLLSFMPGEKRFIWMAEDFEKMTDAEFEYTKIPIPVNYDKVLKKTYGDYNILVKGGSLHGSLIFEPDISYKNYVYKE